MNMIKDLTENICETSHPTIKKKTKTQFKNGKNI